MIRHLETPSRRRLCIGACFVLALAAASPAPAAPSPDELDFFEKKIRPVLAERCYKCHSHDSEKLKGGLHLDSRAGLLEGGDTGPSVEPGHPGKSLLLEAILYKNTDLEMPPKGKLDDPVIADFENWIEMGAPWPEEDAPSGSLAIEAFDLEKRRANHWCWQPVQKTTPPAVGNSTWPASPIDHFILARLEESDLKPAPPADRRALIRRASFDLTGLPPTPGEIDAFLADKSPQAFEAIVDRLLASPRFGERWGRHWLDLVRYAETQGHEFDYPIDNAWRYRDYIIRAFNADLPYDQLIREHVAGDLLSDPRLHPEEAYNESIIGSGFWFFHEATHAPTDVRGDEADHVDNRIDVFSKTFLGLTVACARCHDHKFDAIAASDYYALAGFLQSSRQQDAILDPGRKFATARANLAKLQKSANALLPAAFENNAQPETFSSHLLAAHSAVGASRKAHATGSANSRPDIVFEDFESETYEGWTVDGIAFGDGPAAGNFPKQRRIGGMRGKGVVNSYNLSDRKTGSLTSADFAIARPFINLLVGGGNHPEKAGAQLLADGEVVYTATGNNNENLEPHSWDVREYIGRKARIRIIDNEKGGWGHINVDHIVFSDLPAVAGDEFAMPGDKFIATAARDHDIAPDILARWLAALLAPAAAKPEHPLYAWSRMMAPDTDWEKLPSEVEAAQTETAAARKDGSVFEEFNNGPPVGWFLTGHAFDDRPTRGPTWTGGASQLVTKPGVAHSGLFGDRLCGVLRSPTFEITHPFIHFRIRAKNASVRLIVDGYQLSRRHSLLFNGTILPAKDSDTGGHYVWKTLDGYKGGYLGHKAWLEFIDEGDGHIAVDEIFFSNDPLPPIRYGPVTERVVAATGGKQPTAELLARAYGDLWAESVARLRSGAFDEAHGAVLNWAWENDLIPAGDPALAGAKTRARKLDGSVPAPLFAVAHAEGTPENDYIHIRGSHNSLGDEVPRRFLLALGGADHAAPQSASGRLELAEQLTDPANPLPSRVIVNRLWHHLFGRGIVPTVDDFGEMGQPPSHPELLDWLATEFVEGGWSIKKTIRTIVLSQTYRMSSTADPDLSPDLIAERDATNVLLHRMPVRRLQGETIRDAMLALSGRLDLAMFGPSVPTHLDGFMDGRGRPKNSGPIDGDGRRSIYLEVRRNFLNPMMLAFDMPSPFSTMGRRSVSNVPAQALVLMNSPLVVEQAKLWAGKTIREHTESSDRIDAMFQTAFARPPTKDERAQSLSFLNEQARLYAVPGLDDQRPWSDLAHVLFNKKEFIYVN